MKITEVNLVENITNPVGLKPISMKKIGNMVLLAGKNGSGKTRLLNLVRNQTQNIQNEIIQRNSAKNNIDSYLKEIQNLPHQKQQIEEGILKHKEQIKIWEQLIENQPNQKQRIEPNITSYENNIINWNKQIENQPKLKEQWEKKILKFKEQLNNPIPIIFENNQQNVAVVDFVPNKIELEDWATLTKEYYIQRAN
ncbi:MAG: hypothetical protein K2P52_01015, partial [Campylobacterales bacterium]|nr:hypothetical protein [Campylobacterales bacterium]